jgi:hypothetical protein
LSCICFFSCLKTNLVFSDRSIDWFFFQLVNEEIEALENFRQTSVKSRTSLREKYMSLLEEKKHELDDLKQQADQTLSRPTTSSKERKPLDSLENSTNLLKKQSSFSPLNTSSPGEIFNNKENRTSKFFSFFFSLIIDYST